jgi:hypothetical protein
VSKPLARFSRIEPSRNPNGQTNHERSKTRKKKKINFVLSKFRVLVIKKILSENRKQLKSLSGSSPIMPQNTKYTCNDYREEMRLLGLKKQLNEKKLSTSEKQAIEKEIARLEESLQMN